MHLGFARGNPSIGVLTALNALSVGLADDPDVVGNIGSKRRLDFTVMGQAINLVARIEALCDETGHATLMSEAIAQLVAPRSDPIGTFTLKGVRTPLPVFALNP